MVPVEIVHEHLRRYYRIDKHLECVPAGRASNYRVVSGGSRWLFKVFQPEYPPTRVSHAPDFVSYLARSGYPLQEFAESEAGLRVTVLDGRAAVLIPWVDGDTPQSNTVTSLDALGQIGGLCGRLHRLGSEYRGANAPPVAGRAVTRNAPGQRVADKRAALLALSGQTHDADIKSELAVRVTILDALGDALALGDRAVLRVIHGDFFCSHVVFRGDRAVGVIDVMGETCIPGLGVDARLLSVGAVCLRGHRVRRSALAGVCRRIRRRESNRRSSDRHRI